MTLTLTESPRLASQTAAEVLAEVLEPPVRMTVSQWADRRRILSPESSPEPGPWRTSRAPYTREIMDTLGDPLVRKVAWAAASQVGKTEVVNNFVGYRMDTDPGPMLVVQPSLDVAKAWSKDRLAPMLRDTPVLRGKVGSPRSRDSGNTLLHKSFTGGHLTIVGANSPAGLASRPIRDACFDEVDRYPASAGTEGDPISLGVQRTRNFWNRKLLFVSSPGNLETSRIWREWEESDMRRFFVPCPHCEEFQTLEWDGVQWETDEAEGESVHRTETAAYVCQACGTLIEEIRKRWMLERGEWRVTRPEGRFPGFHLSALYSPWVTWAELAALFVEKKRNPEELKTFVNLQLGEPWEERDADLEPAGLAALAESWPAEVPHGVGVLTSYTDVQDDRLEIAVRGWGEEQESWLIAHHRIYGDPERDEVWERLNHLLMKPWEHESGQAMRIKVSFIDSQFLKSRVCWFVKGKEGRGIYAAQGTDSRVKNPLQRSKRRNRDGVKPWTIDTVHFKTILFRRLKRTASAAEPGGPGYMHFCQPTKTGADGEYYAQFGAEIIKYERAGRRFKRVIKQIRERNEAIDLEAGNVAALYTLGDPYIKRLGQFAEKASQPPDDEASDADQSEKAERANRSQPPRRHRRRGGWADGWK